MCTVQWKQQSFRCEKHTPILRHQNMEGKCYKQLDKICRRTNPDSCPKWQEILQHCTALWLILCFQICQIFLYTQYYISSNRIFQVEKWEYKLKEYSHFNVLTNHPPPWVKFEWIFEQFFVQMNCHGVDYDLPSGWNCIACRKNESTVQHIANCYITLLLC